MGQGGRKEGARKKEPKSPKANIPINFHEPHLPPEAMRVWVSEWSQGTFLTNQK